MTWFFLVGRQQTWTGVGQGASEASSLTIISVDRQLRMSGNAYGAT